MTRNIIPTDRCTIYADEGFVDDSRDNPQFGIRFVEAESDNINAG